MGTNYTFEGNIDITPPLNYSEIKTATKVALGLVRPHHKKYADETNVFAQYMPLGPVLTRFDQDTEDGILTVTRCAELKAPTRDHFLPIAMGDFLRSLMKALPGHEWRGVVVALREDSMIAYKVSVDADTSDPAQVRETKGCAHIVWDDQSEKSIPLSDIV